MRIIAESNPTQDFAPILLRAFINMAAHPLSLAAPPPVRRLELGRRERRCLVAAVTGAHLLGLWALLQVPTVRQAVRELSPMMVELIAEPPAPPPAPAPPTPPRARPLQPQPAAQALPVVRVLPGPAPAPLMVPPLEPMPVPSLSTITPAPSSMHATVAPPPPPPPAPRRLPPSAVRYRVPPPIEVPMASRRLGESGTVLLRVLVDTDGRARQISIERSSGHARLDEQAVHAMRQARFEPYLEDGAAVEGIVMAPLEYLIE